MPITIKSKRTASAISPAGRVLWKIGPPLIRSLGRLSTLSKITTDAQIPPAPYVVAANHFSHLDPPLVGAAIGKPVRFLAVDELWGHSALLDFSLDTFGSIPLSRSKVPISTVRCALRLLERGEVVGVFPESTRVEVWGEQQARRGAGWLAARMSVPLVPVAIRGTDRVFGVDNRWHWGRIEVAIGEPLRGGDPDELTAAWSIWMDHRLTT